MPNFRASLTAGIRTAVNQAIKNDDQKRGRQLATILEKAAIVLRVNFGGDSAWAYRKRKKKEPTV